MGFVFGYGSSQVNISGGHIDNWINSYDSSQVNISGGSIDDCLNSYNSSQVNISGGRIGGFFSSGSSQVNISGGSIGGDLELWGQSQIKIFGSDFAVDGLAVGYGELTSDVYGMRHLTGTLLNGEPINNNFQIGEDARIILIPEPASLALFVLGGLVLRKKLC